MGDNRRVCHLWRELRGVLNFGVYDDYYCLDIVSVNALIGGLFNFCEFVSVL